MDGYAVDSSSTSSASDSNLVSLNVQDSFFPTSNKGLLLKKRDTCYIATGSLLPSGANAVARIEEVRLEGKTAKIAHPIPKWKNVFLQGEDYQRGDHFFRKGWILNSADVALLISLGMKSIEVFRTPKVGILSVGDELVEFRSNDRKTKTVNNYCNLLSGYLSELNARSDPIGICPDDSKLISESILKAAEAYDLIITIGGSSVGRKDLTINSISSITKACVVFHGVGIVPIRPAGLVMAVEKPIVILPANAVSVVTSFFLIALPVLNIISGLSFDDRRVQIRAKSTTSFVNDRLMSALYLVSLKRTDNGTYIFSPLDWGSNLSSNLSRSNGFVELRKNQRILNNEELKITLFGPNEAARIPIAS